MPRSIGSRVFPSSPEYHYLEHQLSSCSAAIHYSRRTRNHFQSACWTTHSWFITKPQPRPSCRKVCWGKFINPRCFREQQLDVCLFEGAQSWRKRNFTLQVTICRFIPNALVWNNRLKLFQYLPCSIEQRRRIETSALHAFLPQRLRRSLDFQQE